MRLAYTELKKIPSFMRLSRKAKKKESQQILNDIQGNYYFEQPVKSELNELTATPDINP
jgi:hypothetical protein